MPGAKAQQAKDPLRRPHSAADASSPGTRRAWHQGSAERFRHLAYELLKSATRGLLRKDFLPQVSERIMDFSGADAVELWVKEDPQKHFRCSVARGEGPGRSFSLVRQPLGEPSPTAPGDPAAREMERLCCDVIKGSVDRSSPRLTTKGSYWTSGSQVGAASVSSGERHCGRPYACLALVRIGLEREPMGLLQLKCLARGRLSHDDVLFYEDVSDLLGIALSHQYAQVELRERIKEMTCLYGIARVMARENASFEDILRGIVELLPPAWLYPEIARARIVLNGHSYASPGFRETPHRQAADVIVNDEKVGSVEVAYLEERLTLDEGPFMAEERSLIDSVAREVANFYERTRAERERALLQQQLRHADRLATIGQLAAGVAHELNEPLGNILGFAQLAKKTPGLAPQVEKDLLSIETASLHAREIIKKLMAFARQLPPRKTPVRLNSLVEDGLAFFEARCSKLGIDLVRRLADDPPQVTVDPGQMNQVLVNLLVNAIQAMPQGGTLTVETRASPTGVYFGVEDTGVGIADEVKDRIFLPFFTTKDVSEGTGLGLAVAHGIVTAHGGTIALETALGRGSRFTVRLPLRSEASEGPKTT